jgi:hypothetical protein
MDQRNPQQPSDRNREEAGKPIQLDEKQQREKDKDKDRDKGMGHQAGMDQPRPASERQGGSPGGQQGGAQHGAGQPGGSQQHGGQKA